MMDEIWPFKKIISDMTNLLPSVDSNRNVSLGKTWYLISVPNIKKVIEKSLRKLQNCKNLQVNMYFRSFDFNPTSTDTFNSYPAHKILFSSSFHDGGANPGLLGMHLFGVSPSLINIKKKNQNLGILLLASR